MGAIPVHIGYLFILHNQQYISYQAVSQPFSVLRWRSVIHFAEVVIIGEVHTLSIVGESRIV
ncbi:hypothetical protein SAMN04488072_111120 [Lentibacillus halodurans]|uniref:Uncharacterized protein n=1 Tax=Lentibacillus halodurans TaxID=237679 RepID=A0A1I0ZIF5_9BACI|nr:hypothetical protein SAMN04488072_111120 [Lentibacillus halodurans]